MKCLRPALARLAWLAAAAIAATSPARAHRVDSLSLVADFTPDGRELTLQVSAEAVRILTATESLSLLPRLTAGGTAAAEVEPEVFEKAEAYFAGRIELWFDGRPVPLPRFQFTRLEVEEKDAVDPERAASAADRKHLFLVGTSRGPVPTGATTFQVNVPGDSVTVVTHKVGGRQVGRAVPEFPGMQSKPFPIPSPAVAAGDSDRDHGFWYFVYQGFRHIIPEGLDHILFVLGLFFLSRELKPLLWQVTAFTVAHSVTLALAMLDVVRLPERPVEVAIAASIAFVLVAAAWRKEWYRPRVAVPASLVIAGFGIYWAVTRMIGTG